MKYCTECGTQLIEKPLKGEGLVPFCPDCGTFRFPLYNVAVSIITVDRVNNKILLIKQYGRDAFILVAGYVNKGENAEHAAARELMEETGLTAKKLSFNKSSYFAPSNTLMLNYTCFVDENEFTLTDEVDHAQWFTFDEAEKNIKQGSLAHEFLKGYLDSL